VGTRCVGNGFNDPALACQPVDAGIFDSAADAGTADTGSQDARADLSVKPPLDAPECQAGATLCQGQTVLTCDATLVWKKAKACPYACSGGACVGDCAPGNYQCQGSVIEKCNASGLWESVATCPDACSKGSCVESCQAGQKRCKDLMIQTCSAGLWQDDHACLYLCSAGVCTGECSPGNRRCRENVAQTCSLDGVWVDELTCTAASPTCTAGRCVGSCLDAGQDCTDPQTSCCQGSECVSVDDKTFSCRAVPACASAGKACSAAADCCAGLDCTGGTCVVRGEACLEKPEDGACTGASSCCPGTVCRKNIVGSSQACSIPSETRPQDGACPRDRPGLYEACGTARFALSCTYSDWAKEPGIFYVCTCNYHGWSCIKNYYV
jgi:hypothetical protein